MQKTKNLTLLGVLIAIQIVLTLTNIGIIPLPAIKATTLHIPVIIGAVLLGPGAGMILGASFGILSIMMNTMQPGVTSFVFSPFITIGNQSGNWLSLVVSIVPRVLIGLTSYLTYRLITKWSTSKILAYAVAGVIGALTNTIFVMLGIYLFFAEPYAMAKEVAVSDLFSVIMGIILVNGIPEAIIAGIVVPAISRPLQLIFRFSQKTNATHKRHHQKVA